MTALQLKQSGLALLMELEPVATEQMEQLKDGETLLHRSNYRQESIRQKNYIYIKHLQLTGQIQVAINLD
jgi:hypothetical protein